MSKNAMSKDPNDMDTFMYMHIIKGCRNRDIALEEAIRRKLFPLTHANRHEQNHWRVTDTIRQLFEEHRVYELNTDIWKRGLLRNDMFSKFTKRDLIPSEAREFLECDTCESKTYEDFNDAFFTQMKEW